MELKRMRTWLSVAAPLLLLVGLVGCSVYPQELTDADNAFAAAVKAGKNKECPNEYAAAEKVNAEAHSLCTLCTRDEAIAKANQAKAMVNALCPPKPMVAEARPAPPPPPPAAPAPTVAISTDSPSVKEGQCANLTWSSSNASSISIDGMGRVDPNGSRRVCPSSTTTYRISASGDGGSRDASTTLTVVPKVLDRVTLHINFDFNKATIRAKESADLQKAIDFAKKYPNSKIGLVGYTDSVGKPEYNQKLSERRAAAVKDYLVAHGVDGSRIQSSGRGANDPIADNKTEKGRAENRRVEIQALSD
jgi:peptidoglycan-associated lipoprotein